jgi:hypothetical protein
MSLCVYSPIPYAGVLPAFFGVSPSGRAVHGAGSIPAAPTEQKRKGNTMTIFCTRNKRVLADGRADYAAKRILHSCARAAEKDAAMLALLPDKFTAEQARRAWGYRNLNNAHYRIMLLEEAGMIELWRIAGGDDLRCDGRRKAITTYRKVKP